MAHPPGLPAVTTARYDTDLRTERPTPTCHQDFDHLALEELRRYREMLADQETRVAYARRILHVALLRVRGGVSERTPGSTRQRTVNLVPGRDAILALVPADGLPALPDSALAVSSEPAASEPALTERDRLLAAYQAAVHARITAATAELIARYRERPTLAVRALPLTPVVHPRDTRY
ncbi:MAG: hypothetical protein ABJC62_07250 [Frankiaceae bacterium]